MEILNDDKNPDRKQDSTVPQVFRIRRGEIYSAISLPVFIAVLGLLWAYIHNNQQVLDERFSEIRSEFSEKIKESKTDLRRELDYLSGCCDKKSKRRPK